MGEEQAVGKSIEEESRILFFDGEVQARAQIEAGHGIIEREVGGDFVQRIEIAIEKRIGFKKRENRLSGIRGLISLAVWPDFKAFWNSLEIVESREVRESVVVERDAVPIEFALGGLGVSEEVYVLVDVHESSLPVGEVSRQKSLEIESHLREAIFASVNFRIRNDFCNTV